MESVRSEEPYIWVEFNDIEDILGEPRTYTLPEFVPDGIDASPGANVLVGDYEGNRCNGTIIDETLGKLICIKLDLSTAIWAE